MFVYIQIRHVIKAELEKQAQQAKLQTEASRAVLTPAKPLPMASRIAITTAINLFLMIIKDAKPTMLKVWCGHFLGSMRLKNHSISIDCGSSLILL